MFEAFDKNSKIQGTAGHGAAIAYYSSLGYNVLLPLADTTDYDLVVDNGENLLKVQVKTSGFKQNNSYTVGLTTSGGNQSWSGKIKHVMNTKIDLLFILCKDGSVWEFPKNKIPKNLNLNEQYVEFYKGRFFNNQPMVIEKKLKVSKTEEEKAVKIAKQMGIKICSNCKNKFTTDLNAKKTLCPTCFKDNRTKSGLKNLQSISHKKKFDPSPEELQNILIEYDNVEKVARYYNVSGNAIRKRAKKLGLL